MLFYTTSYALVENDQGQVRKTHDEAPLALRNDMTRNNTAERALYAQITLEGLLNSWEHNLPARKIYTVSHTNPLDP